MGALDRSNSEAATQLGSPQRIMSEAAPSACFHLTGSSGQRRVKQDSPGFSPGGGSIRQLLFALDGEVSVGVSGRGARLAAADGDQVVAGRDQAVSRLVHIAQVASCQSQLHMLLLAGGEV